MTTRVRNLVGAIVFSAAVAVTPLAAATAAAAPAAGVDAQQTQAGLVNVSVIDISTGQCVALCNTAVSIPVALQLAAQVCGTAAQVGVLSNQLQRTGTASCTNTQTNRQFTATRA
jgi:hypothetical protein